MKKQTILTCIVLMLAAAYGYSQDTTGIRVPARIINGDTLPMIDLNSYMVFPPYNFKTRHASGRYDKLVYNVKKVYPYAKLAALKLAEYQKILDTIPTEKGRKAFTKKAEDELEAQFGDEIRDLTFSQGKVLIKLIYRQTGSSSYELVRELRGKFTAFVWQAVARVFGYDLKAPYDPKNNDYDASIERIVLLIDAGSI